MRNVKVETDKDGKEEREETIVLRHVLLDSASYDHLAKR